MKMNVRVDGQSFDVVIEDLNTTPVIAVVDGHRVEVWPDAAPAAEVTTAPAPAPAFRAETRDGHVVAPIPGVIIGVSVRPGDVVGYGQELCILEAMKMKQAIRSAREGTIDQVHVTAGQHVGHRELLITYSD